MDMNADGFVGTLAQSLKEGRVSQADIDRACRRILEAKYKLGLFEDPFKYLDPACAAKESYTPEHLAAAREAARECMVLLKNDGVLPLRKEARVAVVGPLAKNASAMAGCWSTGGHSNECVTLYDGIAEVARFASYAEGSWLFKNKELEETILYGMTKSFMPGFHGSVHPYRPAGAARRRGGRQGPSGRCRRRLRR
jgi:Beta-glucosidase-related glycosidases